MVRNVTARRAGGSETTALRSRGLNLGTAKRFLGGQKESEVPP